MASAADRGREGPLGDRGLDGLRPDVGRVHAIAGLDEVGHHRQPHVAQPDERDRLHVSAPRAAHRDARTCTAPGRTRPASIPRAVAVSLQRGVEAGQPRAAPEATGAACYNPGPSMLGRDWVLLVTGTLLGVVSLTADLVGLGAFRGVRLEASGRNGGRAWRS